MFQPLLLIVALAVQSGVLPIRDMPAPPAPSKVVAKVNGSDIKASDLEPLLWDWKAGELLNEVIQLKLLFDEAAKEGMAVTDKQVEDKLAKDMEQYRQTLQPGQKLEDALAQQGLSKSRLELLTRYNLLLEKLALKDFSPTAFVKVSTILVRPASEQAADLSAAIAKAGAAYDRLQKGEKWAAVLASTASDPRMAQNEGAIGWRMISLFPATVAEELKKLPAGKYTKPAQTQFGIQIFRVDARGDTLAGEELDSLRQQFAQAQRQAIVNRLQSQAKVEKFLGK